MAGEGVVHLRQGQQVVVGPAVPVQVGATAVGPG